MGVIGILFYIVDYFYISVLKVGWLVSFFVFIVLIFGLIMLLLFLGFNCKKVMLFVFGIFVLGNIIFIFIINFVVVIIVCVILVIFYLIYFLVVFIMVVNFVSEEDVLKVVFKVFIGVFVGMVFGVLIVSFFVSIVLF